MIKKKKAHRFPVTSDKFVKESQRLSNVRQIAVPSSFDSRWGQRLHICTSTPFNEILFLFPIHKISRSSCQLRSHCEFYCFIIPNKIVLVTKQILFLWLPVISYPGHFVPSLVISYLLFGHFVPSNSHFVPRSFHTHFGNFVPRWIGYEMIIWRSIRTKVFSYTFWSFRTRFGQFISSKVGWIDGLTNGRTGVFWLKWQINVLLLIVT